jgi:hypothetical protein
MRPPGRGALLAGCLVWSALLATGTTFGAVLGTLAAPKGLENLGVALALAAVSGLVGLAGGAASAAWAVGQLRGQGSSHPRD